MPKYQLSMPRPDVIRVVFPEEWDAAADSAAMFKDVLAALDDAGQMVTLLIVTQGERPVYSPEGIGAARSILTHDNIKRMIIVAHDAKLAISHMGARRGERGLPPIPMHAFEREEDALPYLK
jgi:hypothetical protein